MNRSPRSVYSTAVAAVIAVALLLVVTLHIVTMFEFPTVDEQTKEAERQRLEELSRTADKRSEAVRELLAGRRSLPETAARFRQLTEECPFDTMQRLRTCYPGYSDDELHYVHVLAFVEAHRSFWGISDEKVKSLRDEFELWRKSGRCFPPPTTDGTDRY
jgi:hypothetical protein